MLLIINTLSQFILRLYRFDDIFRGFLFRFLFCPALGRRSPVVMDSDRYLEYLVMVGARLFDDLIYRIFPEFGNRPFLELGLKIPCAGFNAFFHLGVEVSALTKASAWSNPLSRNITPITAFRYIRGNFLPCPGIRKGFALAEIYII